MKLHKFIVRRFWCYKKISDASINKVPTDKTGLQNIRIFGMVTYVGLFILRLRVSSFYVIGCPSNHLTSWGRSTLI